MSAPLIRTATPLLSLILSSRAGSAPLAGCWESVAIEGATVEPEDTRDMRIRLVRAGDPNGATAP